MDTLKPVRSINVSTLIDFINRALEYGRGVVRPQAPEGTLINQIFLPIHLHLSHWKELCDHFKAEGWDDVILHTSFEPARWSDDSFAPEYMDYVSAILRDEKRPVGLVIQVLKKEKTPTS